LIDRTPEVVLLAMDSDEQFVQIPNVAKATLSSFSDVARSRDRTYGTIGGWFRKKPECRVQREILDITKAHTETVIDPHGIAEDFGWESVSVIAGSGGLHGESLSVDCPS
jgi:hypothetical protein